MFAALSADPRVAALGAAAAVTLLICLYSPAIAERFSVMAHPDDCRKLHRCSTPQTGGMAILFGLMVWVLVMVLTDGTADHKLLYTTVLSAAGVGIVGFADDQTGISPLARILLLIVFVGMAFALDNEFITFQLNWGSLGPTTIPLWAYVPLMVITTVGVVNAVNMADGQDGVVGGMFAVWSGCLILITSGTAAGIATIMFVLSLLFLAFNLRGAIFLGNCGSYGVTFVIGLLVTLAHARGQLSLETVIVWFFIPVMDCLRLIISRPLRGLSPFLGDRDHFHHRLEDKMGKVQGLACYLAAVGLSSVVSALQPRFALVCLAVLCAFYFSFAWLTDANVAKQPAEEEPEEASARPDNVVPISGEAADRRRGAASRKDA